MSYVSSPTPRPSTQALPHHHHALQATNSLLRQQLDEVDGHKAVLEQHDQLYNEALDALEVRVCS